MSRKKGIAPMTGSLMTCQNWMVSKWKTNLPKPRKPNSSPLKIMV